MAKFSSDQRYLLEEQYVDDRNLRARVNIHERFGTNKQGWQRWVFERMRLPAGAEVLELGCGAGDLWLANRDRLPDGLTVRISDFSPGMIETARQRLAGVSAIVSFDVIDAQSVPLDDATVDVIVANHMLYHVPEIGRALSEMRRVLRRPGVAFVTTNGRKHMSELDDVVERVVPTVTRDNTAERFGLETGGAQLGLWFDEVSMERYPDSLMVTDAEAVVNYVRSIDTGAAESEPELASLRSWLDHEIAGRGAFHVTKDPGLFTCR